MRQSIAERRPVAVPCEYLVTPSHHWPINHSIYHGALAVRMFLRQLSGFHANDRRVANTLWPIRTLSPVRRLLTTTNCASDFHVMALIIHAGSRRDRKVDYVVSEADRQSAGNTTYNTSTYAATVTS